MFTDILFWHWLLAGLLLLSLEAFFPGAIFLWMGVSALVVGALAWLVPGISWQVEVALFGALSIASFFAYKKWKPHPAPTDQPALNRRGQSYVGRSFTLESPIVNGVGTLRVDDSQWRISGADAPAGTRVNVVRADGATLQVEVAH